MPWPYDIVACSIGFQRLGRAQPPARPRRESRSCGGGAEADVARTSATCVSAGSASAIFAAPTFDDFWITCATVSAPRRDARRGWCAVPIVSVPGAVWITVSGLHLAGLERGGDRERLQRRAGLEHVGERAVAHALAGRPCRAGWGCTSASSRAPGSRRSATSSTTSPPAFALCGSTAAFSSRNARYCRRESIDSARSRPPAARGSTRRPRRPRCGGS